MASRRTSMRPVLQALVSVLALGGLLVPVATHSQTTSLSELPLKASALAKPNVVFGMDDSGSMDWDVLLNTNSGLVYWNGTSAWNSTTNAPLAYNDFFVPYAYLFPVGTSLGGAIYAYNAWYGQAVPPTTQFAWLRSPRYNPLYYNTRETYKPWSPAYVNGGTVTYANASTTATRSHPATETSPTLALGANWASTRTDGSDNGNWTSNGWRFYVQAGMRLPVGSRVPMRDDHTNVCNWEYSERTTTQEVTVPEGRACWASIPYFPATFWNAETCTVDNTNCITGPDGQTLRRYEIRGTNTYPSGRDTAAELQNFANWFSYYRKRKLMLAGSMGQVLENITGLRMGVNAFSERGTITMLDADSTTASSNRLAAAGRFYLNSMSALGTPTLATIDHIGKQFDTDTNIVRFACQRNSTFIVTDGFANDLGLAAPSYNAATYGSGSPYATTFDGTQAALALAHYTNRLRASGTNALTAGLVKPSTSNAPSADKNTNLHLNFYAISLGVRGSQYSPTRDPYTDAPTWTMPLNDDPSMIDDLWHATINGRGKMYLATTPKETADSIEQGLYDILNFPGAQSGVTVSSVNLGASDGFAYMARYTPARWAGDLTANSINSATAEISSTPTWSAATILAARDWTTRQIAASDGTSGVAFAAATTSIVDVVNPSDTWGADADLFAYLRGDRSKEGTSFRSRTSLMGAVINAQPVLDRDQGVVYVASGEGMLHAFDTRSGADRGKELWAFVPFPVLADIGQTAARSYSFKTQLDGTPTVGKVSDTSKMLVAGMGAAGRHYYALDVTTPRSNTQANASTWVKWTFPARNDTTYTARVGQTVGKPLVVKTAAGYRVVVTSGYNSSDRIGRLFVLNPATGAVEKEFATATTASTDMGLAHVAGFLESTGLVRYVYGGDLLGNLWRFDLDAASGSTPSLVATFRGPGNVAQPVTAAPDLTVIGTQRVILIGTGRMLDTGDWGSSATQTFYALTDGATLSNPRGTLVEQVFTRSTDSITTSSVNWDTQRGWFMDLPSGEQANTRPSVAYGAVVFSTNKAGASDCSASSWMYVVDIKSGGKSTAVDYVSSQISATENASAVTVVSTTRNDLKGLIQTTDAGSRNPNLGNAQLVGPSKNTWREVRRR